MNERGPCMVPGFVGKRMAKPTRTHDPVHLTKRTVDAAKPAAREYVLWDTDIKGFGLKVTPAGR